jgi:hypothetical protein
VDPDDCPHPPRRARTDDGREVCEVCGTVFDDPAPLPPVDPLPPRHPGPKRKASLDAAEQAAMTEARAAIERARATKPLVPNE